MALKARRGIAWAVWGILFIPFVYMAGVVMPGIQKDMAQVASDPGCAGPLDLKMFGFAEDEVTKLFDCLGENGRELYRKAELHEDTLYPLTYGALFAFTIWSLAGMSGMVRRRLWFVLLPLLAVVFDLVENRHIAMLLESYPAMDARTVDMASLGNQLKWSFAFLSLAVMAVFGTVAGIRVMRGGGEAR